MTDPSKHCCKCNDHIEKKLDTSILCKACSIEQASGNERIIKEIEYACKEEYGLDWKKDFNDDIYVQLDIRIADIKNILYSLRSA